MAKIIGIIWVVIGILGLIRPQMLKNRLQKKMGRKLKRIIFAIILALGLFLAGSVIKIPGIPAKIIGLVGLILAIRVVFLFISKGSEQALAKLAESPRMLFRIWAGVILVTGLGLIFIG